MSWQLVFTKQAMKDAKKLAGSGLRPKAEELLTLLGIFHGLLGEDQSSSETSTAL